MPGRGDDGRSAGPARHADTSRRVRLAAFLCALAIATLPAGATQECLQVDHVEAWDFLNIRAEPSHEADIVAAITPGTPAVMVRTGPCIPRSEPKPTRRWCPVDYHPLPGEVRSGFVKAFFTKPAVCPGARKPDPDPGSEPASSGQ
jgi:hypothetical protein